MHVNAYAASSATSPLEPTTIERRDVGPADVLRDRGSGHVGGDETGGDGVPRPLGAAAVARPADDPQRRDGIQVLSADP